MKLSDDLLEVAHALIDQPSRRPKQAFLKRAVSTAYYAMLHALAYLIVDEMLGWGMSSPRYWEHISPLHRSIEHKTARTILKDLAKQNPGIFIRINVAFAELQDERMLADYDPKPRYSVSRATQLVERAREAIEEIETLPREERRALAIRLITKPR